MKLRYCSNFLHILNITETWFTLDIPNNKIIWLGFYIYCIDFNKSKTKVCIFYITNFSNFYIIDSIAKYPLNFIFISFNILYTALLSFLNVLVNSY